MVGDTCTQTRGKWIHNTVLILESHIVGLPLTIKNVLITFDRRILIIFGMHIQFRKVSNVTHIQTFAMQTHVCNLQGDLRYEWLLLET